MIDTRAPYEQLEMFESNYIVLLGRYEILADTIEQVWDAIGKSRFGEPYSVSSPTGKCVLEFVPY